MKRLDTSKKIRLADRLLLKQDGCDILAFDPDSLAVHQFNAAMAQIATACDGETSCEQMVAKLVQTYGFSVEEAAHQVYGALKLLSDHQLLEAA